MFSVGFSLHLKLFWLSPKWVTKSADQSYGNFGPYYIMFMGNAHVSGIRVNQFAHAIKRINIVILIYIGRVFFKRRWKN